MARYKQTKRITPPTREDHHDEESKTKQRKLDEYQHSRRFIRNPSFITFPTDIALITQSSSAGKHDENLSDQVIRLGNKFDEHTCSDLTCRCNLPVISWDFLGEGAESISNSMTFSSESEVKSAHDFSHICDEKCGEEYAEMAMNILGKVLANVKSFESNTKMIECERDERYEEERIRSVTIEYSACGSKCYYKSNSDYEYELLFLLLSPNEYIVMGQVGCHAFYVLPGLEYVNSDGSSPNICSESIVMYDDETDEFSPNIIPLSKVLENSEDFLRNVLANRYH